MKQIIYKQTHPQLGKLKGVLRIRGKMLYFKFNNIQHAQQTINQLQAKGAEVIPGRNWIQVNMFKEKDLVKLGEKEFDVTELSDEDTEKILYDFYLKHFKKAKFEVEDG